MKSKKYSLTHQLYENLSSKKTYEDDDEFDNDPQIKSLKLLHQMNSLTVEAEKYMSNKDMDPSLKEKMQALVDEIKLRKQQTNSKNLLTQDEANLFFDRYSKLRNEYNDVDLNTGINISHNGIKVIFMQDVIEMCEVKESFVKSIISKIFRGGMSTTDRRIKNTIDFFKNVIDYSLDLLQKRNLNIEKIKKTVSRITIKVGKKDEGLLGTYNKADRGLVLYITREGKMDIEEKSLEYSYDETIKSYANTLIHELGHAIDFKFLSEEARNFWISGWKNIHQKTFQRLKDNEGFIPGSYAGYTANTEKTQKNIDYLKQSKINQFLQNFYQKLIEFYNNNPELQEYYRDILISSPDPNTIKSQVERTQYSESFKRVMTNSKDDGINIFENIASTIEDYKKIKPNFLDKDLNIFKKDYLISIETRIMDLYIMGLCSPDALRAHIYSPRVLKRPDLYKAEAEFRDINISNTSTNQEIIDTLLTKIFIAPGNLKFNFDDKSSINPKELPSADMQSHFTNYDLDFYDAIDALKTPTVYSQRNYQEDFAETFAFYICKPDQLSDVATYRMERTLWLSGFAGKNLREALLRRLVRLMLEGLNRRKRTPTSRLV